MKKVKIRVFLLRQKIITLSTTTFVLPNDSTEHLIFFKTNSLSWYTSIVIGIVEMLLLVFSLHA